MEFPPCPVAGEGEGHRLTNLTVRRKGKGLCFQFPNGEHSHPIPSLETEGFRGPVRSSLRCRAAMRCDALLVERAGRLRWWFGPCPARLAGGVLAAEQSAVLAPNARTGSWLQRPWPPWDLAAFFRAVFSSHPRCCAAQCPSRHLHFVPFRPRSGRLDLQTSLSPFCILHPPRPRPALHTLTPHFANSCILAIINCVPTQPKLPSDPPST